LLLLGSQSPPGTCSGCEVVEVRIMLMSSSTKAGPHCPEITAHRFTGRSVSRSVESYLLVEAADMYSPRGVTRPLPINRVFLQISYQVLAGKKAAGRNAVKLASRCY
jgi:hypothetical protein